MADQALTLHSGTGAIARSEILQPNSLGELEQLGKLMAASGFFQDARGAAQACVKILAGREMGFPPIASMTGISIIDGKPATGANLLAASMKRAGYTWQVLQRDAKGCRLVVSFRGQLCGPSEFLEDDAKRANLLGKSNWQRWPRSMYFARAITDAARTYAPEVFAGIPPYTAEELGAQDTTEDGGPIVRNDEVPMLPASMERGSQRAADAVAAQKIAELQGFSGNPTRDAQTGAGGGSTGAVPPVTNGAAPTGPGSGSGVQSTPAAPAPTPINAGTGDPQLDALLAKFQAAQGFDRLKFFGAAKAQLKKLSGDDDAYYCVLSGQTGTDGKPAPLKHANEVKSLGQGKRLLVSLYRACQAYAPPPEDEGGADVPDGDGNEAVQHG